MSVSVNLVQKFLLTVQKNYAQDINLKYKSLIKKLSDLLPL